MKNGLVSFSPCVWLGTICLIVLRCCIPYPHVFADNGYDFVVKAYRNRDVAHTCFVEFSLVSVQATLGAEYEDESSPLRAELLETLGRHKNQDPEEVLQGLLNSFREPQNTTGTYLYRFSTVDQQQQSLFNIFYHNSSSGNQLTPTTVVSEVGPQRIVSVFLDVHNKTARILPVPGFVADFYRMGRIEGEPINNLLGEAEKSGVGVTDILKNRGYRSVGTETYDDSAQMFLLEREKDSRLVERYGVDPSRGFICPIIQVFDEKTGHLKEEYISKSFFLHESSGLWFPTFYSAINYDALTGELVSKKEYTVDSKTVKINQPVSEHEFSVDVPSSFKVEDARTDESIRYRAHSEGVLSLASQGLDLENMAWLSRDLELEDTEYIPPSGGISGWMQLAFTGIGIVLMLIALFRLWRRYVS